MTLAPDNQESGVPLSSFIVVAALVIIAAFAAIWFIFPAPDTRHDLVSPSGAARIELAELCGETACNRVAILDAGGVRTGCPLAVTATRPLFAEVSAAWSEDEKSVALRYVAADGETGSVDIDLDDCTITQ